MNINKMLKNPLLKLDYYKVQHLIQYPAGTEHVYSTWTPRSNEYMKFAEKAIFFGLQGFLKKYLIEDMEEFFFSRPKEEVMAEYEWFMNNTLFTPSFDASHLGELHDLGYIPMIFKALPEGTLVPIRVPMFTMENTNPKFFWVTNYLETLLSAIVWRTCVSATIADKYRREFEKWADITGYDKSFIPFQGHDFSYRGMAGDEAAQLSGSGHLTSFSGTDTIPAILYLMNYYGANVEKELVGTSIPATEHSVMCAGGKDTEYDTIKRLITETYPAGLVSVVSDTWDLFGAMENIYKPLKDVIMARDGRVVVRPDSGDPVKIICGYDIKPMDNASNFEIRNVLYFSSKECVYTDGKYYIATNIDGYSPFHGSTQTYKEIRESEAKGAYEVLYDIFGGKVNDKGYKELDTHIGLIYGDSITVERQEQILEGLANKGFAPQVVLGIGSFTYNYQTRDALGFAIKATNVVINGVETPIFKDPITDSGLKKSAFGRVKVCKHPDHIRNGSYFLVDQSNRDFDSYTDYLETVYENGHMVKEYTIQEIRDRVKKESDLTYKK